MVHTLQRTHFGSIRKTKQLMLYREIITVCSEMHTKHKYSCVDKVLQVLKDWETSFCSMSRENLQLTRVPQRHTYTWSLQTYSAFCHRILWFLNLFFDLASDIELCSMKCSGIFNIFGTVSKYIHPVFFITIQCNKQIYPQFQINLLF